MKLGIIGSGFVAKIHAEGAVRAGGVELVAIASRRIENAEQLASIHHVEALTVEQLLARHDIDAVMLCVPTNLHAALTRQAAEAGKHVLCEKPLAACLEDAEAMVAICAERDVQLCYAEDWLFAPALQRVKRMIEDGAIGRVLAIRGREAHGGSHSPSARSKAICGGGALMHLGSHPLAAARWLVDDEAVAVTACFTGGGGANLLHDEVEGEDWAVAAIEFASGARAVIEANYVTRGGRDDIIEVMGDRGYVKLSLTQGSPIMAFSSQGLDYAVEKAETTVGWSRPVVDEAHSLGFVGQIEHFGACIDAGTPPMRGARGADGVAVLRIALAAADSAQRGRRIELTASEASC